jgi:hypothetical protein
VHNTLGNALAIELGKLLHQVVILQQDGTPRTNGHGVVVAENGSTLVGGPERRIIRARRAVLQERKSVREQTQSPPKSRSQSIRTTTGSRAAILKRCRTRRDWC